MIVATAGHVDHGKTSLVRALTGVDTDRLPEEKRRGLTIEPGFAYSHGPQGEVLGFVDVPGHERFVANMLAGVAAIEFVVLVVAADDGVMPQTREHLAIVDLLGLQRGVVAITKIDRVDAPRVAQVVAEVTELLRGTSLEGAPVHEVSTVDGTGVAPLRARLLAEAARHRRAVTGGRFRLSIDRAFSVAGAGLVVTGAVVAGCVAPGDAVLLSPGGERARVRGLRAQDRPAERACAGERAALNLVGERLSRETVPRGAWVIDPALHAPTRALDARLRLLASAPRSVRNWLPVHVHLLARHVTGHLALLGPDPIEPGESGFVQLVLDEPVGALWGDRFIVRDQSARQTLGGGIVVDPFAPARGRSRPQRRLIAQACALADPADALGALLRVDGHEVDLEAFALARDLVPAAAQTLFGEADLREFTAGAGIRHAVSSTRWDAVGAEALEALGHTHQRSPEQVGLREVALAAQIASRPSAPLFRAVLAELVAQRRVARTGPWLHLPGHSARARPEDVAAWRRIAPIVESDGLRAPSLSALAQALGETPAEVARTMQRLETLGRVVGVASNRWFTLRQMARLAEFASQLAEQRDDDGRNALTAGAFSKASGIGRNMTIEVLEFLDRVGLTRRRGAHRLLLRPAAELFAEPAVGD